VRLHAIAGDLAEEVRGACLGMRVGRLHRIIARVYEQALQMVGLSLPQMEILTELISATGPVRPAALAARLMLERSTVSRNLALMQKRGWVTVAETSPTGRAMSVTVSDTGAAAFTSASTAWRSAQTNAATMLGPAAASILDQWLGLYPEVPRDARHEMADTRAGVDVPVDAGQVPDAGQVARVEELYELDGSSGQPVRG
jgi:DNA-binding MarR family transcriptional regulator